MKFVDGVTVPVCSYSDRTLSVINVNFYFDICSLHGRQAVVLVLVLLAMA